VGVNYTDATKLTGVRAPEQAVRRTGYGVITDTLLLPLFPM
jgi:hypothetical protein